MRKSYISDTKFYAKEIWEAASKIDIVQIVLNSPTVDIKMVNGRYTARCFSPEHNDKHASLYINNIEHGNYIYCFGCGKTWNPIKFIQWEHNCSPTRALEILINSYPMAFNGLDIESTSVTVKWKGISSKDLSYLNLPNTIYFGKDNNISDSISMRDLFVKNFAYYSETILNAIAQKEKEVAKIQACLPNDETLLLKSKEILSYLNKLKQKIPLGY